jgi:hypothetical protein
MDLKEINTFCGGGCFSMILTLSILDLLPRKYGSDTRKYYVSRKTCLTALGFLKPLPFEENG